MRLHEFRVDAQQHLVLARPGAATEENRRRPCGDPGGKLLFLRGITVGDVELEGPCDHHVVGIGAGVDEAPRVKITLNVDLRETAEHLAEEPAKCPVARCAVVGDARVHKVERDAPLPDRADEIGPDLRLGEDHRPRIHKVERTLHAAVEVERIVDEDIILAPQPVFGKTGELVLGRLPSRRRRGGEDKTHRLVPFAQRPHELARDLHLADGDGMNPDGAAPLGRQGCSNLLGIASEAVPHARPVAATPLHAQQERRHHRQVGDGEQAVVDEPLQGPDLRSRGCSR